MPRIIISSSRRCGIELSTNSERVLSRAMKLCECLRRKRWKLPPQAMQILRAAVETVAQLYIESHYVRDLLDFHLLRNAYEDLQTLGEQFYWPNSDRSSIL